MSYDLYVEKPQGNIVTQLQLLVCEDSVTAARKFVQMVHSRRDRNGNRLSSKYERFIAQEKGLYIDRLGFIPSSPDLSALPPGSWFLQFTFTLAKPWISKDDDPFYVAESVNPVRKDKVFKVPMMSAASWKGLLRWTAMHICLALQKDRLSPEEFAQERLVQTLLFGDEKGEETGETKDFAGYLDKLGGKEARERYVQKIRERFRLDEKAEMLHHSGRLMFYPTFFDLIDVEVINPHLRETRAGTHPIYLECVPQGAKGIFSLLYVPFDIVDQIPESIVEESKKHLCYLAPMIKNLFLTYGFSAKRSSGYGVAKDEIVKGEIKTKADRRDLEKKKLSDLKQEVGNVFFA